MAERRRRTLALRWACRAVALGILIFVFDARIPWPPCPMDERPCGRASDYALLGASLLILVLGEVGFAFGLRALRYFMTPRHRRRDFWSDEEDR